MRLTQSAAPGSRLGPGNFIVGAAFLFLFGGLPGYVALRGWGEIQLDNQLRASGEAVRAVVTEKNASVKIADLRPIRYAFTFEGKRHDAHSLVPASQFETLRVGEALDILVLPSDPSRCSPKGRDLSGNHMTSIVALASISALCGVGQAVMLVGLVRGNYSGGTFLVTSRDIAEDARRSPRSPLASSVSDVPCGTFPAFRYARFAALAIILATAALTIGRGLRKTGAPAGGAIGQQPAASEQRLLELWELHPDDRVQFVTVVFHGGASRLIRSGSPYLLPESRITQEEPIGGTVIETEDRSMPPYRGRTHTMRDYTLSTNSDHTGMAMLIEGLPHLHRRGAGRLFSLGNDPQNDKVQRIVCVAVPFEDATARSIDFAPFAQRRVGDWRVFLFDTTSIRNHVSIHVQYHARADRRSLDWRELVPPEWEQPPTRSHERSS
jgi:hypothetical protein